MINLDNHEVLGNEMGGGMFGGGNQPGFRGQGGSPKKRLKAGSVLKVDTGAYYQG